MQRKCSQNCPTPYPPNPPSRSSQEKSRQRLLEKGFAQWGEAELDIMLKSPKGKSL